MQTRSELREASQLQAIKHDKRGSSLPSVVLVLEVIAAKVRGPLKAPFAVNRPHVIASKYRRGLSRI